MIIIGNSVNAGSSPAALLPDQITNLTCVGGTDGTAGTIDISFTEVANTSWDLLKNYVVVYKDDSIPQTPFDGYRIVLEKGTASTNKTYQITGLTFDQLYGVRIYPVSTRYQYQTAAEGATATATPVAGIELGSFAIDTILNVPYTSGSTFKMRLIDFEHYYSGTVLLWAESYYSNGSTTSSNRITVLKTRLDSFYNAIHQTVKDNIRSMNLEWYVHTGYIAFNSFILSSTELGENYVNGTRIDYFVSNAQSKRIKGFIYWTRDLEVGSSPSTKWVKTDGNFQSYGSDPNSYSYALVPAIIVNDSALINPVPLSDGSYNFMV